MMWFLRGLLILTVVGSLSGCVPYIQGELTKRPEPYHATGEQTTELQQRYDVKDQRFCRTNNTCVNVLSLTAEQLQENKLWNELDLMVGRGEQQVALQLQRKDAKRFTGTIVMFHGYGGDRAAMLLQMIYFSWLGFDTYSFDLLGHGEANKDLPDYGREESELAFEMLGQLKEPIAQPLLTAGHSMGALSAIRLAQKADAQGMILWAPMVDYLTASYEVAKRRRPTTVRLVGEHSFREAASGVLEAQGIEVDETDARVLLKQNTIPALIFTAKEDAVAPYQDYQSLQRKELTVLELPQRSHYYAKFIGGDEHQQLTEWLTNFRVDAEK